MNEQPKALRLANALMEPVVLDKHAMQAAAELRRQHDRITTLEAALRQAVEALDGHSWEQVHAATAAAKQALGQA